MALVPHNSLALRFHNAVERVSQFVTGITHPGFSPEEAMSDGPVVDPRLIPRAVMSAENIDIGTLGQLSKLNMKRGKLITKESHPELMAEWEAMADKAGIKPAPQLILAESKTLNALTFNKQEVAITTGLMKILDLREVRGVLAHELGHAQSDHTTARVIANVGLGLGGLVAGEAIASRGGLVHQVRNLARRFRNTPPVERSGGSVWSYWLHMFIGLVLGGAIASQFTVRPTELDADAKGAKISGDPLALASALEKLETHRPEKGIKSLVGFLLSGYPTTKKRVANLHTIAAQGGQTTDPISAPASSPVQQPTMPLPEPTVAAGPMHSLSDLPSIERAGTLAPAPALATQLA